MPVADETAGARGLPGRGLLAAALAAGAALRILLVSARPLWADEVFTLEVARRGPAGILAALRVDSGPPLHYLLAWLLLLPSPGPSGWDVVVRVASLAASLAHVPLLLSVGRRLGAAGAGTRAAALWLLFPLSVSTASEGRAYALASLLVLVAFERGLAFRDGPGAGRGLAVAASTGAALLSHYLAGPALLGVACAVLPGARRDRRLPLAGAYAAGALAFLPWLPVALSQPRASMRWLLLRPEAERVGEALANLAFGASLPAIAGLAGGALLAAAALRGGRRVPSGTVLAVAAGSIALLEAGTGSAVVPERTALVLLPFVALLLAEASASASLLSAGVSVVLLALALPAWLRTTPARQLAETLAVPLRGGGDVVAAGLWGPELAYRLARAGLPGRVVLFPGEVSRHPGWYDERDLVPREVADEARRVVGRTPAARFAVLTPGSVAGDALAEVVRSRGAERVAATPVLEVWAFPRGSGPAGREVEEGER